MKPVAVLVLAAALVGGCQPVVVHESPYSVAVQAKFGDSAMARRQALAHCQQFDRIATEVREKCADGPCSDKVHYFICE